jgi:hypothetical protein
MLHVTVRQIISLLLIVTLITGCQTSTHERGFLALAATELPKTKNVRYSGQYRLYTNGPRNPTTQNSTPILEARLAKGDLLGFALSATGHLVAVVRTEQKPLPDSSSAYVWTLQADPGQFDPDRTILLVVMVLFVGGVALGITAAVTNPFK